MTQILAVASEPPEQSGRPIDGWTHRELADEVMRRGIVPSISVSQVGRYLTQAELQPHRSRYWLNTKEKDPEIFERQVHTVWIHGLGYQPHVALYEDPVLLRRKMEDYGVRFSQIDAAYPLTFCRGPLAVWTDCTSR